MDATRFTDFEALLREVERPGTFPFVSEAVRCYWSGCYRSSLLQTWVSVVVDLHSLLQYLAEDGNGEVRDRLEKLKIGDDGKVNPNVYQNFENEILDLAVKYELLSLKEAELLSRLKDDRNLCAHPPLEDELAFSPSPEIVRAHLTTAFETVLNRPLMHGKRLLNQLQEDLISSSWPKDADPEYIHSRYLSRTSQNDRRNTIKFAISMSVKPPKAADIGDFDPEVLSRRSARVVQAAAQFYPTELSEVLWPTLSEKLRNSAVTGPILTRALATFGGYPFFAELLEEPYFTQLQVLLQTETPQTLWELGAWSGVWPVEKRFAEGLRDATHRAAQSPDVFVELTNQQEVYGDALVAAITSTLASETQYTRIDQHIFNLLRLSESMTSEGLIKLGGALEPSTAFYRNFFTAERLVELYKSRPWSECEQKEWIAIGNNAAKSESIHAHFENRFSNLASYADLKQIIEAT